MSEDECVSNTVVFSWSENSSDSSEYVRAVKPSSSLEIQLTGEMTGPDYVIKILKHNVSPHLTWTVI